MSNRLSMEHSPYLLQHGSNPVDWRPWGPEVFEEAKRFDKPIFLSIGYSTCHWCHVMAHESFEDKTVAQPINAAFLPVKVDREERPDVDAVYMAACVAMNGSGGWPLTVLLTPEQKPFWAGTYLSKEQLLGLVNEAARLWLEDRAGLLRSGEALTAHLRQEARDQPGAPSRDLVQRAVVQFAQSFDRRWGGFGPAPKFPTPHNLIFLLRHARLTGDGRAREMALETLDAMYRGGLFDHVGGGFSRYSTDERWLVPHFEKMLYDNALLALAYTEAFQHTCRPLYEQAVRRTLDYVLRELSGPQGGFCCGQAHRRGALAGGSKAPAVLAGRGGRRLSRRTQLCPAGLRGGAVANRGAGGNCAGRAGGIGSLSPRDAPPGPDRAGQNAGQRRYAGSAGPVCRGLPHSGAGGAVLSVSKRNLRPASGYRDSAEVPFCKKRLNLAPAARI